ncbi:probable serine/threonine-protein kinase DDB_G0282963 isoform X6 [Ochlerotatus camptorhynchus]|uniref:probable serine/threonine-protein kinase DDB_G0282963 isoform X6 n=1 Tax=Ochlerotatus camptorhynchus TaxID=644619 RepID=UPI0031DDAF1D
MMLPHRLDADAASKPLTAASEPIAGRRLPMGKCASKQPVSGLNEFGSSPYLAICSDDDIIFINVGQSESKKASKKAAGLETKGTAMSFGFKKHKIHQSSAASKLPKAVGDGTGPGSGTGTLKKTQTTASNGNHLYGGLEKEKATERDNATVISNPGVDGIFSDKNGNMGSADQPDDDTTKTTGRSTPRLQPPKKDSHGAPYRNNRFGFRSTNVVRPASAGLQPKSIIDYDKQHSNNNNNIHTTNNNNVYITDKRRSKSASAAASARTTFTPLLQAPSQVQQERSSALQHTGFGALHKPQPKYQSAHGTTKIASSESGAQQVMTKCDQAEHKNTSHNPPSAVTGGTAATSGSTDEQRSQSSVNNTTARQCVSANDSNQQQQHVAANSLIKPPSGQEPASVAKFTLHSSSLPKPQYPVPISLPSAAPHYAMDPKGAKQAANVCRKGILHQYQREPSTDHMFDLDQESNPDVDTTSNIRMPRQRYRNLEMILSGRHKFEVRDLETLTAEPIVSLALPQLPSAFNTVGHQQQPIPLSGLVRSSELSRQLSDDIDINDNRYESSELVDSIERKDSIASSDVESFEEEKLARDNNSSEKSLKGAIINDLVESRCSKTSSSGSSRTSWCNAGESMAAKECSSLSLSSSDESNVLRNRAGGKAVAADEEDVSSVTITAGNPSLLSSFSAPVPMDISTNLDSVSEVQNSFNDNTLSDQPDSNRIFRSEEYKFAEIAAAVGDAILLDDETSPTDSLVSSCTESDDARKNRKKPVEGKPEEREKEKDIDEISPELEEIASPVTPGTPTHASNSLSLSDGGRDFLIDDEIADQPALVFDEPTLNDNSMIDLESINLNILEDTPTLRDSVSSLNNNNSINNRSLSKSVPPVPKPRKIMAATYESPASIRKNRTRLSRAESLDTLSPCDSIASDDYMLDFNSSMDSIDRPPRSNASGSTSALHSMDELQLWSELENKGGQLMHEWSKLLRSQRNSNYNTSRESITSLLPARATRLLTRRLQNNATPTNCGTGGSDSPRSMDSLPRRSALSASYKTATLNQFNNNNIFNNTDSASTATNSAEDLTLLDKSLRNSMIQDVVHFKKQLVRLRRILQETDTLNPFENNNGQFFTTATTTTPTTTSSTTTGATGETGAIATSVVDSKQQENTLIKESGVVALALLEDQRQELADLRRQVVYLQGEITAKDRTIRQQQNLIEKYEAEREKLQAGLPVAADRAAGNGTDDKTIDTISTATQTERLRPLSFGGQEGLASRSEPPSPLRNGLRSPAIANSNSSHHHHHANGSSSNNHSTTSPSTSSSALINSNNSRGPVNHKPKTQISSVYTQLSSIKHSNHHHHHHQHHGSSSTMGQKRSSLGSNSNLNHIASSAPSPSNTNGSTMKTVRTTLIGNVLTSSKLNQSNSSVSPPPPPPTNGTKLLKTSIRTQMNGGNGLITSHKQSGASPSNKRSSAIKPPSSFANSTFPADSPTAHKSKSAPVTPMTERVPATPLSPSSPLATPNVQIVIETVDNSNGTEESKENAYNHEQQNGGSSPVQGDDANDNNNNNNQNKHDDDDDKEQIAEKEKDAINNKINSLKLANGLTGCNDSSCKESSLVI